MRKMKTYRPIWLVIGLLIITGICVTLIAFRLIVYFKSPSFADYLWSLRISRELNNKGYPVHDVSVSDSEPPGFRIVDVQVGNLVDGEQQRTYELIKAVHKTVMDTFTTSSFQPDSANVIFITLFDYSSGIYTIGVDFEKVQEYQRGEITEEDYFGSWSYSQNTPDISPP